jgi:hypothetical protein
LTGGSELLEEANDVVRGLTVETTSRLVQEEEQLGFGSMNSVLMSVDFPSPESPTTIIRVQLQRQE